MSSPGIFSDSMEAMTQPGEVRVRRALLSVSDKTGVVEFARGLVGYPSQEIKSRKLQRVEVVHRDNLVVL